MFQDLVIRCSIYCKIVDLPAKHYFCARVGKFNGRSKTKIGNKYD